MLETINDLILIVTRPLLDWMLALPRDMALAIVAVGTALVLTGVRVFTTDQKRLRVAKADKARLKELMREAKRRGDKEAVARHRATQNEIAMLMMRSEGKPLLASIVPIALLAVWAFASIAYLPPEEGDAVKVKATFPIAEIGRRAHIVPQDGIEAATGWIQRIEKDYNVPLSDEERAAVATGEMPAEVDGQPLTVANGLATWTLRCKRRDEPYVLQVRYEGETFKKQLIVDGTHYAPTLAFYDSPRIHAIETPLADHEYKPFGVVPGIEAAMLQPWIVGYLVIVIPFSLILKPVLRIY